MTAFLRVLARVTASRKKRAVLKETMIGFGVGGLIAAGGSSSLEWTLWALVLYFVGVQGVALSENDVFCDFGDFRRLGFRELSLGYRVAYLTDYLARDLYLANAVAIAVMAAGLTVLGQPWVAVCLATAYLANLAIIPSHVHLAFRLSEQQRIGYIAGLLIAALLPLIPLVAGWRLSVAQALALPAAIVALVFCHIVFVDVAATRIRGSGLSACGGRRWVAWLLPRAPHLAKDLLLGRGMALQSLLAGVALFALLLVGSPTSSVPALIVLAIGHDNLFLGRRKKAYRLTAEDHQFAETKLPADRGYLRLTKLATLALDLPVKLLLAAVLVALPGARWDLFPVMALVLAAILVASAPLPYLAEPLARFMRGVVGYALISAFAIGSFAGQLAPVVVGCLVVVLLYAPSLVLTYAPWVHPTPGVVPDIPHIESCRTALT